MLNVIATASSFGAQVNASIVAVLYPQMEQPYKTVFDNILNGIISEIDVQRIPLGKNSSVESVKGILNEKNIENVIVLGRQALTIARELDDSISIIAGAILASSKGEKSNISTISMVPDPALLLKTLKNINPNIERIHVLYNSIDGANQINQAKKAAGDLKLTVSVKKVQNHKDLLVTYKEIVDVMPNGDNEAIWVLYDSHLNHDEIFNYLLDEAWKKRITIFSSNGSHVERGALFSLFPDNYSMGRQIGIAMKKRVLGDLSINSYSKFFKVFKIAVNLRAAEHLGIDFSKKQLESFGLLFPAEY